MRIISGMRRGMKLKAPEGLDTRPTTDRVKESVFNIIQFQLPAQCVLDLFAGSGALGLEALSRGSDSCVFVESGRQAAALIKENIQNTRFQDRAHLLNSDAISFLEHTAEVFDLIFLDPPYNKGLLAPVLDIVRRRALLSPDGIIVVETEQAGEPVPEIYPVRKVAVYGKTVITILQNS